MELRDNKGRYVMDSLFKLPIIILSLALLIFTNLSLISAVGTYPLFNWGGIL